MPRPSCWSMPIRCTGNSGTSSINSCSTPSRLSSCPGGPPKPIGRSTKGASSHSRASRTRSVLCGTSGPTSRIPGIKTYSIFAHMKNAYSILATLVLAGLLGCKPAATTDTTPASDAQGVAATGQGTVFNLDAPRSQVKWSASKPTGTHNGIVPIASGTLTLDNGQLTGGQVEINMAGIEVHDLEGDYRQSLEGHLRGTTPGKE